MLEVVLSPKPEPLTSPSDLSVVCREFETSPAPTALSLRGFRVWGFKGTEFRAQGFWD